MLSLQVIPLLFQRKPL